MFLWFFLFLLIELVESVVRCASCATPMLKGNWHVTGLPSYPDDSSFFDESCLFPIPRKMNGSCSGLCLEMTFPLNGVAQIVRGCYEDFFRSTKAPEETELWGYIEEIGIGIDFRCEFSLGNETTVIGIGNTQMPVTSVRLCEWESSRDGAQPCNVRYYTGTSSTSIGTLGGEGKEDILIFCSKEIKGSALTCKSCNHFGNDGECSRKTRSTCDNGRYCIKIHGNAGGNRVEMRGCAMISPYSKTNSFCTKVKNELQIPGLLDIESFKEDIDVDICFCNDRDSCNHSMNIKIFFSLFILFLLILC